MVEKIVNCQICIILNKDSYYHINHRQLSGICQKGILRYFGQYLRIEQFYDFIPTQDLIFSLCVTIATDLYCCISSLSLAFCKVMGDSTFSLSDGVTFLFFHRFFRYSNVIFLATSFNYFGLMLVNFERSYCFYCQLLRVYIYQQSILGINEQSKFGQIFMDSLSLLPISQADSSIYLNKGSTMTGALLLCSLKTKAQVLSALLIGDTMMRSRLIFFIFYLQFQHYVRASSLQISQSSKSKLNLNCQYGSDYSNCCCQFLCFQSNQAYFLLQMERACLIKYIMLTQQFIFLFKDLFIVLKMDLNEQRTVDKEVNQLELLVSISSNLQRQKSILDLISTI